jgi:O-antigen/teichoic acid export membrane protein
MLERVLRLARQSLVYGLGGLVSRILAVLLLPLYTRHLRPSDYGDVETIVALTAVLATILRFGLPSAFFRFYYLERSAHERLTLIRTSFWFTMGSASAGLLAGVLLAGPISRLLFGGAERTHLVDAAFVGLWAQLNYEQLVALFRVEQRPGGFVAASVANVLVTVAATFAFVVGFHAGALGVVAGNLSGTLVVYLVLLAYRRDQLGFAFDARLLRRMNRFGLPLMPAALALWAVNFADRFFIVELAGTREVGLYSIGVRISSAILLLVIAFSTAWPAFAYSIEDEDEARRTYAFVLTYVLVLCSWLSLGLGLFAPWIVRLLTTPPFYAGARVVGLLGFSLAAYAGYTVLAIGIGRTGKTRFNWIVTGTAALLNTVLNLILIPREGMMGAAIATLVAYAWLFALMAVYSRRVYPAPHQWRRIAIALASAGVLFAIGDRAGFGFAGRTAFVLLYPALLGLFGFLLPRERSYLRRLALRLTP